jgi:xylulokinase
VTKWAWLRAHEPETVAGARRVELPHDFLTGRLTGRHVTDRGDASGTGWWSTASEDYDEDVLSLPSVGLDRSLLPAVLGPREAAGTVVGDAAATLGLPEGIPVGPGTGDNMAAALGLGLRPGTPVVSLGTSGTVYAAMTVRAADLEGVVAGFADAAGGFLPLTATLNATLAVDRMAAWLGLDRDAVEPSGSVTVLPYLDGERTPNLPHAAGTIAGLRHTTTGGAILMAAYEGAAAGLVDALDRLAALGSGLDRDAPLVLIGGGARGRVWPEVVGRLSGRPLLIPRAEELVALGAAVQAAAILRDEDPGDVARRWRTQEGSERPAVAADTATLERIRRVRAQTADLLGDVDPR